MDAGQARCRQQLGKASFRLPGFQGNAVEQQFRSRNPLQESAFARRGQSALQFFPGGAELRFRALVIETIETHVFHQDVEAVNEGACRLAPGRIGAGALDAPLLGRRKASV